MRKVVLTHDLHVLYNQDGRLVQKKVNAKFQVNNVVCIKEGRFGFCLETLDGKNIFDSSFEFFSRSVPTFSGEVIFHENDVCSVKLNGNFMRANPNGDIDFIVKEINGWEKFLCLEIDDFLNFVFACEHEWVSVSTEEKIKVNLKESNFQNIKLANWSIGFRRFIHAISDVRDNLNFLFMDEWKVHKLFLLKPAIVFVVFGRGKTLKQFEICIQSLDNPAFYRGDIFIITDLSEEEILSCVPLIFQTKLNFMFMKALDQLDFVGARLSIFNTDILEGFQPIVYSDVDVIFDKNIDEFLRVSAMSDKCSAQIESFHFHKDSPHAGGTLFQKDEYVLGDVHGFNGGILMVPNLRQHGENLRACYHSLRNYTSEFGRDSIPFYDQRILNYILYKVNDFSPSPVTECTQVGGEGHKSIREMFELNPRDPKGFVHFWNTSDRVEEMEIYLGQVREHTKK